MLTLKKIEKFLISLLLSFLSRSYTKAQECELFGNYQIFPNCSPYKLIENIYLIL